MMKEGAGEAEAGKVDETLMRLLVAIDQWRSSISRRLADLARQIEEKGRNRTDWEQLEHHVLNAFPELHTQMARCAPPLTPMETRVFLLTGIDVPPAEVARLLRCSRQTVLRHRSSIRRKLAG